jgi:hypothetical protein
VLENIKRNLKLGVEAQMKLNSV